MNEQAKHTKNVKPTLGSNAGKTKPKAIQECKNMRVSKNTRIVETTERNSAIYTIMRKLLLNEITQGEALKILRIEIIGLKQADYAKWVGVSRKTLSDVENDRGSFKTDVLDRLFRPFGLKTGVVPIQDGIVSGLFMNKS